MRRQVIASFIGGVIGSFIQSVLWPEHPPVLGFVLGGLVGFAVSEALTAAV